MENHIIKIENRKNTTITEVTDVKTFNDEEIKLNLFDNGMIIQGKNLNVEKLDLDEHKIIITGTINSLEYTGKNDKNKESLLKRILK